jgi:peroxiredoxin Q/BCP
MGIIEGRPAPAFDLNDQNGDMVSSKDLKGRRVLLYFYPRDDTPGCTKEACGFRDLQEKISAHGVHIFGISPDKPDKHLKFIDKYDLNFTLLCDPEKKVMKKFGAFGEKMMYGKKTQGVIRSTVLIDANGKVSKHWRRVQKAAEHPEKVLEFLDGLKT